MKATLKVSILLNLALLGAVIVILANQREKKTAVAPGLTEAKPTAITGAVPAPVALALAQSNAAPAPFHWSQLMSAKDYRLYIANLRAIGCPEATLEDIVRGDTGRAFSWERRQLNLDGSGDGPWSQAREMQLVASLLNGPSSTEGAALAHGTKSLMKVNDGSQVVQAPVPPQSAGATTSSYPLFLQNVNWSGMGFSPDQQAAIAQVRQQFQSEINGANQTPGDTANQSARVAGSADPSSNPEPNIATPLAQWQTALQNADDQLQAQLGAQGYAAYEQQQYYAWYQPQVLANAEGANLTINPEAFSSK